MSTLYFKQSNTGWIFLILVLCLYIISIFINISLVFESLSRFFRLFYELLPVLLVVFALIYLFNLLDPKSIKQYLRRNMGMKKYLMVSFLGILSLGPIYMWYPLLADTREKGLNDGLIATFLYARAIKLPLLPLMISYFSLNITIIFTLLVLVFSFANGFLVNLVMKGNLLKGARDSQG